MSIRSLSGFLLDPSTVIFLAFPLHVSEIIQAGNPKTLSLLWIKLKVAKWHAACSAMSLKKMEPCMCVKCQLVVGKVNLPYNFRQRRMEAVAADNEIQPWLSKLIF